jgi:hypothetical protein
MKNSQEFKREFLLDEMSLVELELVLIHKSLINVAILQIFPYMVGTYMNVGKPNLDIFHLNLMAAHDLIGLSLVFTIFHIFQGSYNSNNELWEVFFLVTRKIRLIWRSLEKKIKATKCIVLTSTLKTRLIFIGGGIVMNLDSILFMSRIKGYM